MVGIDSPIRPLDRAASPLQADVLDSLLADNLDLVLLVIVLVVGGVVSYLVFLGGRRLLIAAGMDDTIEGTTSERTLRRLGTSTVTLLALLFALFVALVSLLLALNVAAVLNAQVYWLEFLTFLPQALIAALVVLVGLILADKAELLVSERLRSVKLPQTGIVAQAVKYSVLFVAGLIALGQIGVATAALLVAFGTYAFGLVVLSTVACKDLLTSSAAGVYLLLAQPYAIGDEVRIDGMSGIVQEVGVVVTHIENDDEEFVVPNRRVLRSGIARVR